MDLFSIRGLFATHKGQIEVSFSNAWLSVDPHSVFLFNLFVVFILVCVIVCTVCLFVC